MSREIFTRAGTMESSFDTIKSCLVAMEYESQHRTDSEAQSQAMQKEVLQYFRQRLTELSARLDKLITHCEKTSIK